MGARSEQGKQAYKRRGQGVWKGFDSETAQHSDCKTLGSSLRVWGSEPKGSQRDSYLEYPADESGKDSSGGEGGEEEVPDQSKYEVDQPRQVLHLAWTRSKHGTLCHITIGVCGGRARRQGPFPIWPSGRPSRCRTQ
eukprot:1179905-Rhodomonas_salina.1